MSGELVVAKTPSRYKKGKLEKEMQADWKNAKGIIGQLSTLSNFDNVCDISAFRVEASFSVQQNPNGILVMLDGDHMKQLVNRWGDPAVDVMLRDSIVYFKEVLKNNGIEDYFIGKMGDEIYIYIPQEEKTIEEEKDTIGKKIVQDCIEKKGILTFSAGYTTKMDNGLEQAMQLSSEVMKKQKTSKNVTTFKESHQDNGRDILKAWIKEILGETRQDKKNLTKKQEEILRGNIQQTLKVNLITPEDVIQKMKENEAKREKKDNKQQTEGIAFRRMEEVRRKLELQYVGIELPAEFIKDKIEEDALKYLPIPNVEVERIRYFEEIGYQVLEGKNEKETIKNLSKESVLYWDLGKMKQVNDARGYNGCDQYAVSEVSNMIHLLEKCQIQHEKILAKGMSGFAVIIPSDTKEEQINTFLIGLEKQEKKSEFTFNCAKPVKLELSEDDKEKFIGKSTKTIINTIYRNRKDEGKDEANQISSAKKIMDIDNVIIDRLVDLTENAIIVEYCKECLNEGELTQITKEAVNEYLKENETVDPISKQNEKEIEVSEKEDNIK